MTTNEKFEIIETAFGGPGEASKAAGVRYSTWHRWKQSLPKAEERTLRTLDLLLSSDKVLDLKRKLNSI